MLYEFHLNKFENNDGRVEGTKANLKKLPMATTRTI